MDATAKLIAIVALAAFATERILATANYLMDSERLHALKHALAAKMRAKEERRVVLLALAGAIALLVVDRTGVRILRILQGDAAPRFLDYWLTWLVLFAGADRARDLLQGTKSAAPATKPTPVVKVQLDGPNEIRELRQAS